MPVVDDRWDARRIRREQLERLVDEAREGERLGYLIRVLVETSLPHRPPENPWRFVRRRSGITLTLASPAAPPVTEDELSDPVPYGLPYGSLPRVLLAWLGGEYKRTGERLIQLGPSHGALLRTLGLVDGGGGPRSDRARLRWQLERLFAATVTSVESAESIKRRLRAAGGIPIIDGQEADPSPAITRLSILDTSCEPGDGLVWWHPRRPGHMVWRSSVLLGTSYCQALERAFPVSPRVLAGLRRSPLAIDLYCWLTYFFFGFRDARGASRLERVEPWEALEGRLGADYGRAARRARRALDGARNSDPDGDHRAQEAAVRELERKARSKFRDGVVRALVAVKRVYPEARVEPSPLGLRLRPSPPNVAPRPPRR